LGNQRKRELPPRNHERVMFSEDLAIHGGALVLATDLPHRNWRVCPASRAARCPYTRGVNQTCTFIPRWQGWQGYERRGKSGINAPASSWAFSGSFHRRTLPRIRDWTRRSCTESPSSSYKRSGVGVRGESGDECGEIHSPRTFHGVIFRIRELPAFHYDFIAPDLFFYACKIKKIP
jgi:hypothetical protein